MEAGGQVRELRRTESGFREGGRGQLCHSHGRRTGSAQEQSPREEKGCREEQRDERLTF